MNADVIVRKLGTITLLQPITPQAEVWFYEHIADEALWNNSVACDLRLAPALLHALRSQGFRIGGTP